MKTSYRIKKEAKELALYREYKRLTSSGDAMKTAVEEVLMKKFKIESRGTVWKIFQRVEKRLAGQTA